MGCDPGQNGGIAIVGSTFDKLHLDTAWKMPDTLKDLLDLLRGIHSATPIAHCFLEKVHSMPSDGGVQAFKFGYNYGALEAFLICAGIPITKVTPQVWQKNIGCLYQGAKKISKTEKKNINKKRAQELFPNLERITHAIADALLIAEYGRRVTFSSG